MNSDIIQTWSHASEDELPAIAAAVIETLTTADAASAGATVLGLYGNLGAGKTTFTKACATALGVTETITSPTFVIMKQYNTTHATFTRLVHIDAYRIEAVSELAVLGWSELRADTETLIVLEWPSRVAELLPKTSYALQFTVAAEARNITFSYGT